jgi:hypothetical protein
MDEADKTSSADARSDEPPQKTPSTEANSSNLTTESVYQFYTEQLYPALLASLPLLSRRIQQDARHFLGSALRGFVHFIIPKWLLEEEERFTLPQLWQQHSFSAMDHQPFPDFILRYFDGDRDGHISRLELLNMTEVMKAIFPAQAPSWWVWFSREWPLMDWKIGVFLWQTFGGMLLLLTLLSIIPGKMHGMAARVLRWPVLGLTYFLILVELMYVPV